MNCPCNAESRRRTWLSKRFSSSAPTPRSKANGRDPEGTRPSVLSSELLLFIGPPFLSRFGFGTRLQDDLQAISVPCRLKRDNHLPKRKPTTDERGQINFTGSHHVGGPPAIRGAASRRAGHDQLLVMNQVSVERNFFFNDRAPAEIYTLSVHDALPI